MLLFKLKVCISILFRRFSQAKQSQSFVEFCVICTLLSIVQERWCRLDAEGSGLTGGPAVSVPPSLWTRPMSYMRLCTDKNKSVLMLTVAPDMYCSSHVLSATTALLPLVYLWTIVQCFCVFKYTRTVKEFVGNQGILVVNKCVTSIC